MAPPAADDVLAALRDFVRRVDALDPGARRQGELVVGLGGEESRLAISPAVARALVEALRAYHDPRDRGGCEHCGGRRLDDNFLCGDCGRPNGLFGRLIAERVARHAEHRTAAPAPRGRHAREDAPGA